MDRMSANGENSAVQKQNRELWGAKIDDLIRRVIAPRVGIDAARLVPQNLASPQ